MLERKKQKLSNEEWIEAVSKIEELVSFSEITELSEKTVRIIEETTENKESAFAWSGGKDSIVLADLCEKAKINKSMIALSGLEYPTFEKWCIENSPEGCTVIRTGQDLKWLSEHQFMLFPQESSTASHWFSIVQHSAQRKYFKDKNLEMILLGRRKADGNYVGKGTNIYSDSKGVTRFSPLSEWEHKHILAYIHYFKLQLPPIYEWANGYVCGTHPWPARQHTGSEENGWREVYSIDKSIVINAAEYIPGAAKFLEVIGK